MIRRLVILLAVLATPAFAQQQPPDPAFLQRALVAMQAQRNQAMDSAAVMEAKLAAAADELTKANARIKELESKPEK